MKISLCGLPPTATLSGDVTAKEGFVFPVNGQVITVGSPIFSPARDVDVMSEIEQPPCHHKATSLRIKPNFPRDIE